MEGQCSISPSAVRALDIILLRLSLTENVHCIRGLNRQRVTQETVSKIMAAIQ